MEKSKIWRANHQLCPIARRQQFWIFLPGYLPKFQNWSKIRRQISQTLLNRQFWTSFVQALCRILGFFMWICISDKNPLHHKCKFKWKTPEFGKVLEQKKFRTADLVEFDITSDEFEKFWNFGIFPSAKIQNCCFRSIGRNWWISRQNFTIFPLTKFFTCEQIVYKFQKDSFEIDE